MATSLPSTSDGEVLFSRTTDPLLLHEDGELKGYGKETYTLMKYVLQEMAQEQNKDLSDEDPFQRAQRYTGLHINTLKELSQGDITVNKVTEVNRKCVHDALMSFYLDKQIMPTATELFDSLHDHLPPYEDIRSFRKKLVKMGYLFKKKQNSFVVYEKPSIRFERFLYLKNIIQYRQNTERPIYYISELGMSHNKIWNIDEIISNENIKLQNRLFFAVSFHKGVQFSKCVTRFDTDNFNSWILNDVLPNLDSDSVVILDNTEHHCGTYCETPNKYSPGYVMAEWLTFHEIPFNKTISTVELFTLIEKYTDIHVKLYKPDIWLKQNGHNVLRLPDCINEMTPAAHVRHLILKKIECNEETLLTDIADSISDTELNTYISMLQNEESRLYNLEIKLDLVLDTLMPSLNVETDLNLPSLSDSD